jgi:hypothetical protein
MDQLTGTHGSPQLVVFPSTRGANWVGLVHLEVQGGGQMAGTQAAAANIPVHHRDGS